MKTDSDLFREIIFHMNEGVIFLDRHHIIQICNPAAEKIRKVKADQIVGRSIFDIHPRRAHPKISELLANLQTNAFPSSHRIVAAQGRFFDNSYSSIHDSDGQYLGTLLVSRDITEQKRLAEEVSQLKNVLTEKEKGPPMVFNSPAMLKVLETTEAVAALDSTVLITGESGCGKECIVELIHQLSPRHNNPLIRVNCGALPENLIESELFGHDKGAFTGAYADKKGKFVAAASGTLFLDEIGELPLLAQVKLLRVIQDKIVQPVGGHNEISVDVRIVAATNQNLFQAVKEGRFREDIFYRLNVISIEVPPLRERPEDIIPLAEAYLKHFAYKMNKNIPKLSVQARELLLSCPFPGNVRQLKHAMERAIALGRGNIVLVSDLPLEMLPLKKAAGSALNIPQESLKEALSSVERELIRQALALNNGRKQPTAETLGITRKTLWEKIQRYQLEENDTKM